MGTSLILRDRSERFGTKRFVLQVRVHDLSGTEYGTIAFLTPEKVRALVSARIRFLFDPPADLDLSGIPAGSGRLVAWWDRSLEPPREYALDVLACDGTRIRIAELAMDPADDAVATGDATWEHGSPFLDPEHVRETRRRKAEALRAQAAALEAEGT